MPDLDTLLSAYDVRLIAVSYETGGTRMDATFMLRMGPDRFDEPLHDRLIGSHDGMESADWLIDALDTDLGDDWATCVLRVEALNAGACRVLQPHVVRTLPLFN